MAKKKSCQNIRVPRVLFEAERDLFGWVDDEIFTHPSVVEADMFPELRREMRKKPPVASSGKPFSVEREEGAKEDPSADLKQKKRKWGVLESSPEEAALGAGLAWEHKVNPIDRAFPAGYNFRAALDSGLT
ncbi:hypothetical protein PIB30_090051 [Stylosanthes scabra]|uniref:Uncharacterized protein n=1 Tax=Stylosanthes scabra TaxID=79078 RepID=A0ABU6XTZ8_9FABA|nr:hypothetical protein [Stylosanthes scabra]